MECVVLTSIDLSSFKTSRVKNMACMFKGCVTLTYLDISNFDTSITNNFNSIFDGCTNLERLNLVFLKEMYLKKYVKIWRMEIHLKKIMI